MGRSYTVVHPSLLSTVESRCGDDVASVSTRLHTGAHEPRLPDLPRGIIDFRDEPSSLPLAPQLPTSVLSLPHISEPARALHLLLTHNTVDLNTTPNIPAIWPLHLQQISHPPTSPNVASQMNANASADPPFPPTTPPEHPHHTPTVAAHHPVRPLRSQLTTQRTKRKATAHLHES